MYVRLHSRISILVGFFLSILSSVYISLWSISMLIAIDIVHEGICGRVVEGFLPLNIVNKYK